MILTQEGAMACLGEELLMAEAVMAQDMVEAGTVEDPVVMINKGVSIYAPSYRLEAYECFIIL